MAPFSGPVTVEVISSAASKNMVNPTRVLANELAEQLFIVMSNE
jgi:hypothetical protein